MAYCSCIPSSYHFEDVMQVGKKVVALATWKSLSFAEQKKLKQLLSEILKGIIKYHFYKSQDLPIFICIKMNDSIFRFKIMLQHNQKVMSANLYWLNMNLREIQEWLKHSHEFFSQGYKLRFGVLGSDMTSFSHGAMLSLKT